MALGLLTLQNILHFHCSQEHEFQLETWMGSSVLASWHETEAKAETWLLQAQLAPSPAPTIATELSRFLH